MNVVAEAHLARGAYEHETLYDSAAQAIPALLATVTAAAKSAGVSRIEWLRRAAAYCVVVKVPLAR